MRVTHKKRGTTYETVSEGKERRRLMPLPSLFSFPATRKQALLDGVTRYFTGKPCLRGHVSVRLADRGTCLACRNEALATRYRKRHLKSMRDSTRRRRERRKLADAS